MTKPASPRQARCPSPHAAGAGCGRLLAGCSLIPTYERPAAPVAPTGPAPAPAAAASGHDGRRRPAPGPTSSPTPRLRELIRLALANNRDLRVAVLNIEQARAQCQIRRADQFPTVNAGRHRHRAAQDRRQRRHQQRLHRRPGGDRLGDRLLRPRRQPEGRGAGAVPGHRGGAQGRADQPDRRRGQHLAEPAGRRRTAGASRSRRWPRARNRCA